MRKVPAFIKIFLDSKGPMHAAALTYYSLLAVVPILCCILVLAKVCRVDQFAKTEINTRIDALIENVEKGQDEALLATLPLGDEDERERKRVAAAEFAQTARKISNTLFSRIESFDISTFGWIGFGFLLWTAISTLTSVEASLNVVFGVSKMRPIWKRALLYLGILIILPLLAMSAMSLPVLRTLQEVARATLGSADATRWASDGVVWLLNSRLFGFATTLLFSTMAFAFLFWVLPFCRVRVKHALVGGVATSLVFGLWLKICAVAQVGIAKSSALYGSFAFLPIVLAWLCMSWQIFILGASFVRSLEDQNNCQK